MKRLAWLLLVVVLSLSSLGSAPLTSPAPSPAPASIPGYNIVCHNIRSERLCASVSKARVVPGSYVTIYGLLKNRGEPVQGKLMRVIWQHKGSVACIGITDENGLASCTAYFPSGGPGGRRIQFRVFIDKHKISTFFITRNPSQDQERDD